MPVQDDQTAVHRGRRRADAPATHHARLRPGTPYPLGATWDGSGTNFAIFSANAEKVELCLFDRHGRREIERIALPEHTDEVWHGYLPDVLPGQLYGYRVHGPYAPEAGHRFNPNKLVIDPYARALAGEVRWHDALFGYVVGRGREDLTFDRRDSAFVMPKCIVVDGAVTTGGGPRPEVPWSETVIYEAHVKGFTRLHPDIPEPWRGSFLGLAQPEAIDHLKALGITTLELMPVHAFVDDRFLADRGLRNYWGYSTLAFFAPAPRYVSPGGRVHEFKLMVRRLHDAGIEVVLDVVYNHTAEGNQMGPTLSFRGIDNASYYKLAENPRFYFDTTGCGNTLDLAHPRVLQMVTDSLRFWVEECGVDGFRFDLAPALGRDRNGFDPDAAFFQVLRQDPVLSRTKLISEPWDLGPDGYRLGGFPPGWVEWNGRYRDDVRSFWRGDPGYMPKLAASLLASADLFDGRGRKPYASVNFVTAHDGFTLADLVAYENKHNEANGEHNADGHDDNRSFNCGHEGPTDDGSILNLRDRMRRNLMTTLLFSQGTPMLLMGDEIGRTQNGNNNAYCQDNDISWMPWDDLHPRDEAFRAFVSGLMRLRAAMPLLRHGRFLHGLPVDAEGTPDVAWLHPDGAVMQDEDWHDGVLGAKGLLLAGENGERLLAIFNRGSTEIAFHLGDDLSRREWQCLVDTAEGTVTDVVRSMPAVPPFKVAPMAIRALVSPKGTS